MVAVNIFDPIVIMVLIYTVLISLLSLYTNPYGGSFILLLTIFALTSYCYYKVNKNEPILIPVCEKTPHTSTPPPTTTSTPFETTSTPFETTTPPFETTTMSPTTTPPSSTPITTLPTI